MDVWVYAAGAAPGANVLAQGTLGNAVANSLPVTIAVAPVPALVVNTNYVLAVGAQLQNNDKHKKGYPSPVQLSNINATVYTFIV